MTTLYLAQQTKLFCETRRAPDQVTYSGVDLFSFLPELVIYLFRKSISFFF